MNKVLPVNPVKQKPGSFDCLRACALMVYAYYKIPITKKKVFNNLPLHGTNGTYFTEVGRHAISLGLKAQIYHYEWAWWDKTIVQALRNGNKQLSRTLKKRNFPSHITNYLDAGGKYVFELPEIQTIDNYIKKETPIIVALNASDLYHDPNRKYRHTLVVTGKKDGEYQVNDPLGKVKKVPQKEFEFAWIRNSGYMLVIEK